MLLVYYIQNQRITKENLKMAVDVIINKLIYKITFLLVKFIPIIISCIYFSNTALSFVGIDLYFLSLLSSTSLLMVLFLYLTSYLFKFCNYHRLPIHYILINDIIQFVDYKCNILSNWNAFLLYILISFIFLIFYIIFRKHEHCKAKSNRIS